MQLGSHVKLGPGCHSYLRSPVPIRRQLGQQLQYRRHHLHRGSRRCPLKVQAGLNYPHMPNRMRRQIQEFKYTVQLYLSRVADYLGTLPGLKQAIQAWRALQARLKPYVMRWKEFRENTTEEYLKRVDKYDDFCLEELKRKYRWRAYARKDEAALTGFLKMVFYRISVVMCIAEWEFLAPTALMWTLFLPLLVGRALIRKGDIMWWWYCATMVIFIILKHPIGLPPRWI